MTDIAVVTDFTARPLPVDIKRTMRRIRALLRLRRIERGRGRVVRIVLGETNDPRVLADIGIDGRWSSRCGDRFESMAVAVGARWSGG